MNANFCPAYAPFLGALGIVAAITFCCTRCLYFSCFSHSFFIFLFPPSLSLSLSADLMILFHFLDLFLGFGAAYGTAKSGVGISTMGVMRPELIMKCIIPIIMAGIVAIYGVVISVLLSQDCK